MLNRFTHDYLETLAACDFAPKPRVSGRLASYDGLLMEAVGLSLPVGTVCKVGDQVEAEVIGFRNGRTLLMNLGGPAPLLPQAPVRPTGGTGDVLTGVIAALIAQGLSAFDAAALGAWVHGRAGDIAAQQLGQTALTATDLLDTLPLAFRELESNW